MSAGVDGGPATRGSVPAYRIPGTGYDISFGRSQDPRRSIGAEMRETGIAEACRRVEAFDGTPAPPRKTGLTSGERGCLRSNLDLVDARHRSDRFAHVLKDDMVFAGSFRAMIESFLMNGLFDVPALILASPQDPPVSAKRVMGVS